MEDLIDPTKQSSDVPPAHIEQESLGAIDVRFKSSIFDSASPFEVLMVEEFSDLNLVIGSNIIAVHQLVLASHSKLLAGGKKNRKLTSCNHKSKPKILRIFHEKLTKPLHYCNHQKHIYKSFFI